MCTTYIIVLIVTVTIATTLAKEISSLAIDKHSATLYVAEKRNAPYLYEVDSTALIQIASSLISSDLIAAIPNNSLVEMTRGPGHYLYAILDSVTTDLVSYPIPIQSPTLIPQGSGIFSIAGQSLTLSPVYDVHDKLLVASVSMNLALVDMNTFTALDSIKVWGTRIFGRNVVYNHNNKHVIVLSTLQPVGVSIYGLSVEEYDVSSGAFVEVPTSYACHCESDPQSSPFYETTLIESSCEIDYQTNMIWCSDSEKLQFLAFQADDLSKYTTVNTTVSFTKTKFDFALHQVYAFDTSQGGISINAVDLDGGAIIAKYSNSELVLDANVVLVDYAEEQLYVAVADYDDSVAPKVAVFNTADLQLKAIVSLLH